MFGHDDNQKEESKDTNGIMPAITPDPSTTAGLKGIYTQPSASPGPTIGAPDIPNGSAPLITPASSAQDSSNSGIEDSSVPSPAQSDDESSKSDDASPATDTPAVDGDLLDLKKQALQQLSPLVGQLDQTPEEKFRTTMMMIQASDDKSLVKAAFESAGAITDDKARAQALLDVINEINYFTQHKSE